MMKRRPQRAPLFSLPGAARVPCPIEGLASHKSMGGRQNERGHPGLQFGKGTGGHGDCGPAQETLPLRLLRGVFGKGRR